MHWAIDFVLERHGSVCLLQPVSDAAVDLVASGAFGGVCLGSAVGVDLRVAPALIEALEADGYTVSVE